MGVVYLGEESPAQVAQQSLRRLLHQVEHALEARLDRKSVV